MHTKAKWQFFFRFSAVFNFVAAFGLLFITELFFKLLGMAAIYTPEVLPWAHQFGVLVLTFGVGYWVISQDPDRHGDIVWMGCLGKTLVFVTACVDSLSMPALIPFAVLTVADLIFAIFFYRFRALRAGVSQEQALG